MRPRQQEQEPPPRDGRPPSVCVVEDWISPGDPEAAWYHAADPDLVERFLAFSRWADAQGKWAKESGERFAGRGPVRRRDETETRIFDSLDWAKIAS